MAYLVQAPEKLRGIISLPASKSISNRALILKALSRSIYPVKNLSVCEDTEVMQRAFSQPQAVIDIGAAGTSMRFLTAYFSTLPGERVLTGTERMKNRPIAVLVNALREIGADIEYLEKEGYPPLKIRGKELEGGEISLDAGVSSQYISALMMIAPVTRKGLRIVLKGKLVSKPYIRMTEQLMEDFGVTLSWLGNHIRIKRQDYRPAFEYLVESDWSAASYWYEIVALSDDQPEIELLGLQKKSCQGDAEVAHLFEKLGVSTVFTEKGVILKKNSHMLSSFKYDFVCEPDLAQTFVVTCALKNIPFRFSGLQSLRIKETDRIAAMQQEMQKLGYVIEANDQEMWWDGTRCDADLSQAIHTYEDHRMSMAFAPVALVLGPVLIDEPDVVKKSYPSFWKDLQSVGFKLDNPAVKK